MGLASPKGGKGSYQPMAKVPKPIKAQPIRKVGKDRKVPRA